MELSDLIRRHSSPAPWGEAENIPWDDPAFSERMLREHLSQGHDRASRRSQRVTRHVRWLHEALLGSRPSAILDLACGPGLYTRALAELGHTCLGIDCAPASIAHARRQAESMGERCRYLEADIRSAPFGDGRDLCTFLYGELNSLAMADAETILTRAYAALAPGGRMIAEVHTEAAIQALGSAPSAWYTAQRGLFSDEPHLVLKESFWNATEPAAIERFFVVELPTARVTSYSTTSRAYTDHAYRALFARAGFGEVEFGAALGDPETAAEGLFAIVARRRRP